MGLPLGGHDNTPAHRDQSEATGSTHECSGVEMVRGMSLPTGRGDQQVRSCGRARKWEGAGRPLGMRGGGDVASIIGALLSEDSTGCSGMMAYGREYKVEKSARQDSILWGPPREEDRKLFTNGDQPR
jgi:hypothetical protein